MSNKLLTFTQKVKKEITEISYTLEGKKGLLSGFIRIVGSISILPSSSLRLQTTSASVSKCIYSFLKEVYKVNVEINYTKQLRLDKKIIYHLEVHEKVKEILDDLEISNGLEEVKLHKMLETNYFPSFTAGLFLACGQISDPNLSSYFCELSLSNYTEAKQILSKLLNFKKLESMNFKIIQRRKKYILYLKRSDQISMFLSFIGASNMMFEFENARLEKDYFNNQNRLIICNQANYAKSLKTGEENLEDIKILNKYYGESYFTDKMKDIIKVRKENKDIPYSEIAKILSDEGKYISKSGVAHIFKKMHLDALALKEREIEIKEKK